MQHTEALCQKFFAMILYLKVVAYTGKIFREDGISDIAFFLPFGIGKGWGCMLFREGTTEQGLLGNSVLAPRTCRIHLDCL